MSKKENNLFRWAKIKESLCKNILNNTSKIYKLIDNNYLNISTKPTLSVWFDQAKKKGKFKSNFNNSMQIYYFNKDITSVKLTLSDWFNMAKTKGHFDPIQKKYTEIDYYEIVSKLTIIQDPLIKNKLANWFDQAKKKGHFKPKNNNKTNEIYPNGKDININWDSSNLFNL